MQPSESDDMQALTVGIVGAGAIARLVHVPVLSCMSEVRVDWICDVNNERARSLARAHGVRAVELRAPTDLPACDVVLLAIPVGARTPYYEYFADRDAAILAEKPFALSTKAHRDLIARFAPHRLGCGYMRRFYAPVRLLRELVANRPFGSLLGLTISEGGRATGSGVDHSYVDDPRQSAAGGILSELGCHSLDLALFVTGAMEYQIRAVEFVFDGQIDRKVEATILLGGAGSLPDSGVPLEYCVSWLDTQANMIELEFERCTVWTGVKPDASVYMGKRRETQTATKLVPPHGGATTINQAFFMQWRAFLDGVRTGAESGISAASALLSTTVVEDLYARGRGNA